MPSLVLPELSGFKYKVVFIIFCLKAVSFKFLFNLRRRRNNFRTKNDFSVLQLYHICIVYFVTVIFYVNVNSRFNISNAFKNTLTLDYSSPAKKNLS